MTDVNIVANGNTARLLELECMRLDLEYLVSSSPVSEAKVYVIDFRFYRSQVPYPSKTIAIDCQESISVRFNLKKPFLLSELRQYIKETITAVPSKENSGTKKKSNLSHRLILNAEKQTVKLRRQEISLSQTEFKLLSALLEKDGNVLTHGEINDLINGGTTNKANVYICFLRKKLESEGEKIIYSVRGKGFKIRKDT